MSLGSVFCVLMIGTISVLMILASLSYEKYRITISQFGGILLLMIVLILGFTYEFKPRSFIRWDLLMHYRQVRLFRNYSFAEAWRRSEYQNLYLINFYFYLVSRLPNYKMLPVIPLAIDLFIARYILLDRLRQEYGANGKFRVSEGVWVAAVFLATMGLKLAISGIRCVLAVSLCALAFYLEGVQKKKKPAAYLLYLSALLVHHFSILVIAVRLLVGMKGKWKILVGLALFCLFGATLSELVADVLPQSINYLAYSLRQVARRWDAYSFQSMLEKSTAVISIYLTMACAAVYLLYVAIRLKKVRLNLNRQEIEIYNFAETVAMVGVGMSFNYLFLERIMYIVAFGFLMTLPVYLRFYHPSVLERVGMFVILLWLFFFNDLYVFIVNYVGYYFLAW